MIGLVCLALSGGQAVLAQATTPNNEASTVARPVIRGEMLRKLVIRGKTPRDTLVLDTFTNVRVRYDQGTKQWSIFTVASSSMVERRPFNLWVKYNERTGRLIISTTKENRNDWSVGFTRRVKVTIAEDKSTLRLDFLMDLTATAPSAKDYNWMKGSWLEVTR
jgi:hypothetical protein